MLTIRPRVLSTLFDGFLFIINNKNRFVIPEYSEKTQLQDKCMQSDAHIAKYSNINRREFMKL